MDTTYTIPDNGYRQMGVRLSHNSRIVHNGRSIEMRVDIYNQKNREHTCCTLVISGKYHSYYPHIGNNSSWRSDKSLVVDGVHLNDTPEFKDWLVRGEQFVEDNQ